MVVAGSIAQASLRAAILEWRCRHAWHVEALGGGEPLDPKVANETGSLADRNGLPFMWGAEAPATRRPQDLVIWALGRRRTETNYDPGASDHFCDLGSAPDN